MTNQSPIIIVNISGDLYEGQEVTIDASYSYDPDGTIKETLIRFGDGEIFKSKKPTSVKHIYKTAGNYTVSVSVKDNKNNSSSKNMKIAILQIGTPTNPPSGGGDGTPIVVPNQSLSADSSTGLPITVTYPSPPIPVGGTPPYTGPVYSIPESSTFPIGTTAVSMTFTDSIGNSGVGYLSVTIVDTSVPIPPDPPPSLGLINPSTDITSLGAFYALSSNSADFGMSGFVDPDDSKFKLIEWVGNHIYIYEPLTPSLSTTFNVPLHPTGTDLGVDPYSVITMQSPGDIFTNSFVHYDNGKIFFGGTTFYQNASFPEPCIGYIEKVSGTWTIKGFWAISLPRASGGYGQRWITAMCNLPTWFSNNYASGRKYAVGGGGGYFQGIHSNDTSVAPTLFALGDLNPTEPNYGINLWANIKPLMYNPYNAGPPYGTYPPSNQTGTSHLFPPRVGRRPTYPIAPKLNRFGNPKETSPFTGASADPWLDDPDGTSYYSTNGDANPAMIWIEGDNKKGVIFGTSFTHGFVDTTITHVVDQGTAGDGIRYWTITVADVSGFEPNMLFWLEDPTSPHYGGWACRVGAFNERHFYAPNLPEGFTTNPISGSDVSVYVEEDNSVNISSFTGRKVSAGNWYGGGGGKPPTSRPYIRVYDPAKIAIQAQNNIGPWSELDCDYDYMHTFWEQRAGIDIDAQFPVCITAFAWNALTKILYAKVFAADRGGGGNSHMIYALHIPSI